MRSIYRFIHLHMCLFMFLHIYLHFYPFNVFAKELRKGDDTTQTRDETTTRQEWNSDVCEVKYVHTYTKYPFNTSLCFCVFEEAVNDVYDDSERARCVRGQ